MYQFSARLGLSWRRGPSVLYYMISHTHSSWSYPPIGPYTSITTVQKENNLSNQMQYYSISLCDSDCHLVNVTELYTRVFSASCFHAVTLDLSATGDLTGLTDLPPPKKKMWGVCLGEGSVGLVHCMFGFYLEVEQHQAQLVLGWVTAWELDCKACPFIERVVRLARWLAYWTLALVW